jgi:hypothetical protein
MPQILRAMRGLILEQDLSDRRDAIRDAIVRGITIS